MKRKQIQSVQEWLPFENLLENGIITPGQLVEETGCSAEEIEQYCYLDKGTLTTKSDSKIIALKESKYFA